MESVTASAARFGGISLLRLQPDERLAEFAAAGHGEAFEVLVRRYRASLVRAARRVLPPERAEDAVQQALLNAHQSMARNGAPDNVRPWLHRIAINAALRELEQAPAAVPIEEELVHGSASAEDVHEQRDELRSAVGAIGSLPDNQRRALIARELEGRGHEEIARELGLSGGAVRQLIHRARNSVRAAVSAVIPAPLIWSLMARAGEGVGVTATEAVTGGVASGLAAKAAVATLLAGGIAGGVAVVDHERGRDGSEANAAVAPHDESGRGGSKSGSEQTAAGDGERSAGDAAEAQRGEHEGDGGGESGRDGPGGDDGRDHDSGSDNSGSSENSGPGSTSSGSGHSGSGGSGSDSSGSGSSGSGSSGSGSSGSGSSGSGSGSGHSGGSDDDAEVTEEDNSGPGGGGEDEPDDD